MRPNKSLNYKNLEPYQIKKAINNFAYELNLPESISAVHPVFHSWLLHLNESNLLSEQHDLNSEPIEIAGEKK